MRCHGEKVRKADLDLRTPAGVLKGGESGPAVVAGKPDKSLLYEKVHKGEMPPEEGSGSASPRSRCSVGGSPTGRGSSRAT